MRRTIHPPGGIDSRGCKEFRRDSFDVPTAWVARAKLRGLAGGLDMRTVITSGLCRPESHGMPTVRGIRCPHRHKHNIGMIGVTGRAQLDGGLRAEGAYAASAAAGFRAHGPRADRVDELGRCGWCGVVPSRVCAPAESDDHESCLAAHVLGVLQDPQAMTDLTGWLRLNHAGLVVVQTRACR